MIKGLFEKTRIVFGLALLALATPLIADAQGRYANVYSKRDVSGIISRLEQTSNTFRRDFDRYLDQSSLNGSSEEDRLNQIVQRYERDLNRLRNDYDRWNSWWESRGNVQEVMDSARTVNGMMNTLPFARRLERQWRNMRRDLNRLADTFDLPELDNASGGGNVPNWAVGTFYARNPQTGGIITLTINQNANVSVDFQGAVARGTFFREQINIDGAVARVSRTSGGIRTTRVDNGEVIDYYRTTGGNWGGGGGNVGVPNWAIGTFYATNPQTGGTITLTINANGTVTADLQGAYVYGSFANNRLYINGAEARVQRTNGGIRTIRTDNGERIDYSRR
jgi:hypothetical protein